MDPPSFHNSKYYPIGIDYWCYATMADEVLRFIRVGSSVPIVTDGTVPISLSRQYFYHHMAGEALGSDMSLRSR